MTKIFDKSVKMQNMCHKTDIAIYHLITTGWEQCFRRFPQHGRQLCQKDDGFASWPPREHSSLTIHNHSGFSGWVQIWDIGWVIG